MAQLVLLEARGTLVLRVLRVLKGSKGQGGYREKLVLVVILVLMAKRERQVTLVAREKKEGRVILVPREKKEARVIWVARVPLVPRVGKERMGCKEKLVQVVKRVTLVLVAKRERRVILDYRGLEGRKAKRVQLEHLVKMGWMVQPVRKENVALQE